MSSVRKPQRRRSPGRPGADVPRLGLTRREAATALGMSLNSFERHVQPSIRLVRSGKLRIVPVGEIERWLKDNARLTLENERRSA